MTAVGAALAGGFSDAPIDAARTFRSLIGAFARPGRVVRLDGVSPPAPLSPGMGAAALTLCDPDAPVWLAAHLRVEAVLDWLRFHCGAPILETPEQAAFAFGAPADFAPLDRFAVGTPEYPDRSTTLVVAVERFAGAEIALEGPGVDGVARLPLGADASAILALAAPNRVLFPQGRDLILVAGADVAAIPRSSRLTGV